MLWSMQSASSDDEDGNLALDSMGGLDGAFAGMGFSEGAPTDSHFESVEQHAKQVLPSSSYSWPGMDRDTVRNSGRLAPAITRVPCCAGPPSVPDTWSITVDTQCDGTDATVLLMYVGEAEVGTGPGPFQILCACAFIHLPRFAIPWAAALRSLTGPVGGARCSVRERRRTGRQRWRRSPCRHSAPLAAVLVSTVV
jgi:hypothetical protein